jgi:hypothetical protein
VADVVHPPAVDCQHLRGDPARFRCGQEHHRIGDTAGSPMRRIMERGHAAPRVRVRCDENLSTPAASVEKPSKAVIGCRVGRYDPMQLSQKRQSWRLRPATPRSRVSFGGIRRPIAALPQ